MLCYILYLFYTIDFNLNECRVMAEDAICTDKEKKKRGWIIKAPFSANRLHFNKTVRNSDEALNYISRTVLRKIYGEKSVYELPYLTLQEYLFGR